MRLFSIPPPTLLAGFLAVLIGYASSAAIIWQAAIVAGATTAQISGWMTALGLAMGVSTLTLTLWVCQSGRSIYVVWKYVAGMAGNQGRCAALCGNCRDDYWDRDRYRAR